MSLSNLFTALADVFDGPLPIENQAQNALREAAPRAPNLPEGAPPLPAQILQAIEASDAHPVCSIIAQTPFDWAPPTTSDDPQYIAHSHAKVHVELLGPDGLVTSHRIRLGLYGILPHAEYGIRTHPAEEIFVMLAGSAGWIREKPPYVTAGPGARSYHPSMMPHATRTTDSAFLSAYAWIGDISTASYHYHGLPEAT